jgi:hypothetical protein
MKSFLLSVPLYATLMVAGPELVEHRNSSGAGFTLGTNGPEVQAATTPIELYLEQVKPLRDKFDEAFSSKNKDERQQALDTYNKGAKDLRVKFDEAIGKTYLKNFAEQFKSGVHKAQRDFDTARNAWTEKWLENGSLLTPRQFEIAYAGDLNLDIQKRHAREQYAGNLKKAYDDALKVHAIDHNSLDEKFKKEFIG